jgi:hypothetical protein
MTDAIRPSGGASSELRRTVRWWDTDIPLLSADPFNLDARLVIGGQEYIRCTGRTDYTLTGCTRGVSREEGGSEAKTWPGGTSVDQVSWSTTEVVTVYPTTPTLAMVGREFAWDALNGNVYRYHVVLIEGSPVVIWDDEPPGAGGMAFLWASQITGLTNISGVAVDPSGNIAVSRFASTANNLIEYNASLIQQWTQSIVNVLNHVALDGTSAFVADPQNVRILKRVAATGAAGTPTSISSGSGPTGVASNGTHVWFSSKGAGTVDKFTVAGVAVAQITGLTTPTGIALASGKLYVLNAGAGEIRRYDATTHVLEATLVIGNGTADGQISTTAEGIAVDSTGRIWIADTGSHRIQVYTSAGLFLGKVGSFGSGSREFKSPKQLAAGAGDLVYVADSGNNRLVTLQDAALVPTTQGPYVIFSLRAGQAAVADIEWTNQPSAATELWGQTFNRKLVDLSNSTQYLYSTELPQAGNTTAVLDLEYTTDLTGATGWTSMAGGTLALSTTGFKQTGWVTIPSGARARVLLRVMGSGGNGTADPRFNVIAAQFR